MNKQTQDQIASVMLQHGTPDQQTEALGYAIGAEVRERFEQLAKKYDWTLHRFKSGAYSYSHVEWAFIGFCMANQINHLDVK